MILPTLTFTGLEDVLADIDRRLEDMHAAIHRELDWFGRTTSEEMIATHTFQNRTYRLETSIGYIAYYWTASAGWRVVVEASAPYAEQVEWGHPGPPAARPYPFFWPVFWKWEPVLWERMQASGERTFAGGGEV